MRWGCRFTFRDRYGIDGGEGRREKEEASNGVYGLREVGGGQVWLRKGGWMKVC